MDKTSSVVTGSAAAAAVFIAPLIDWLLNAKCGMTAPGAVVSVISVLIVGGAHLACNILNDHTSTPGQPPKAQP